MDRLPTNPIPTPASRPRSPSISHPKTQMPTSICSSRDPYTVEKHPTFGQWIKITWLDILTIFVVGAWAFPVYYLARPLGIRVFPLDNAQTNRSDFSFNSIFSSSTSAIPPEFAYPARPQMVSNWLIALIAIAFPTAVMLLMQISIRSFWDLNNGLLGFLYALLTSSAFQATVKAFVGGLRPNFYDVCQPDSAHATGDGNKTGLNGIGFRKDMWTRDVCTTTNDEKLRDAMQGFPSGHSTTMMAAMVYLCLYLNAKLKVFANYHTPLWKLVALVLPMLGAVLLCGTLIIDNTHNWYDIAGGATIGTLVALASFRMVYASIFDWRFNHIPLNRNVPFDGFARTDMVATTRAGWRSPAGDIDTVAASHDGAGGENRNPSRVPL